MLGYGHHDFLNEYIRENECEKLMEIGVDKGNNAVTVIETAKEKLNIEDIKYFGFDYFENEKIFRNANGKLEDTGCNFRLFRGPSTKTLPEVVDELPMMDLIFIDGGKKYETVKSDLENSKKLMRDDTTIFVHNYEFDGVRKGVNEMTKNGFKTRIIDPENDYKTAVIKREF